MSIVEKIAMENPMKWSAIENPIEISIYYIQNAVRWIKMNEVQRLIDVETPEEFENIFENIEDEEILNTLVDIWSVLN